MILIENPIERVLMILWISASRQIECDPTIRLRFSFIRHYLTTLNYHKPMRLVCVHLSLNKKIEGIASLLQFFFFFYNDIRVHCIKISFRQSIVSELIRLCALNIFRRGALLGK